MCRGWAKIAIRDGISEVAGAPHIRLHTRNIMHYQSTIPCQILREEEEDDEEERVWESSLHARDNLSTTLHIPG